jgi:hypothetical protein
MDTEEPKRRKDLRDSVAPTFAKSRTESDEPSLAIPKIDTVLPIRMKLRTDNVDAMFVKSRMDKDEPNFDTP